MAQNVKVAFIDRDGVINKNSEAHHYVCRPEDFVLNPGVTELLLKLQRDGFVLVVITNQRGIARGLLSVQMLHDIHDLMLSKLSQSGIRISAIFYCPHEDGVCDCRKPKPGLLQQAFEQFHFDKDESIIVSDTQADITMGLDFGLKEGWLCEMDTPLSYRVYE